MPFLLLFSAAADAAAMSDRICPARRSDNTTNSAIRRNNSIISYSSFLEIGANLAVVGDSTDDELVFLSLLLVLPALTPSFAAALP